MPSVITAGTATNTALNLTSDTSGELQIRTNNGATTALTLTTGGNINIPTTGARITGDFGSTTFTNRVAFQSSGTNENTGVLAIPNGTATIAQFIASSNSDPTNSSLAQIAVIGSTDVRILSNILGTGTYLPLTIHTGGSERLRIDTSGNVGIGTSSPAQRLHIVGNQQLIRFSTTATESSSMNANTTNSVIGISAPFGANPASVANAGARWGITFTGNGDSATNIGGAKSASVFAVSEDSSAGYNRSVGLSFFTSSFDASQTERMRIDSVGNVNINTVGVYLRLNSPSSTFDLSGQAGATDFLRINANGTQRFQFNTAGQAYNSTGTWGTISDARLKENIADATPKLDSLNQLRVVNFNFKDEPDVKQIGFIAQEVEQIFPGLISEGESDGEGGYYKAVKTTVLIPMLVKAIQELKAELDEAKAEIQALKGAQ